MRFDFDNKVHKWVSSRSRQPLIPLLREEMEEVFGTKIPWDK